MALHAATIHPQDCLPDKNQNGLDSGPRVIDECIRDYCPTYINSCLFATPEEQIKSVNPIPSELMRVIYNEYNNKTGSDMTDVSEQNIKDFYKKLQLCILCVANISVEANNPPPIPYIDINFLKTLTKYFNNVIFGSAGIKEDKDLYRILFTNECIRIACMVNNVYIDKKMFNSDAPFNKFNELVKILKNKDTRYTVLTDLLANESTTYNDIIKLLSEVIQLIDNSNTTSTIGTLEFMDQSAKYNRTDIVCIEDVKNKAKKAGINTSLYNGSIA